MSCNGFSIFLNYMKSWENTPWKTYATVLRRSMNGWQRRWARGTGTLAAALALPLACCSWLIRKNQFWTEPKSAARSRNSSFSASVCEKGNQRVCVCVCVCLHFSEDAARSCGKIKAEFGEWRSPWDKLDVIEYQQTGETREEWWCKAETSKMHRFQNELSINRSFLYLHTYTWK